jgi:predicted HicB family RNase H-like nuclease
MSYKGYAARMIFDAEDKIIVGRVLDVDDILTFHRASASEFETNFHAVMEDYISACEQLGSANYASLPRGASQDTTVHETPAFELKAINQ